MFMMNREVNAIRIEVLEGFSWDVLVIRSAYSLETSDYYIFIKLKVALGEGCF